MANSQSNETHQIGDAVLVHIAAGVDIPGVVEDDQNGQYQVRLAEPWADETGRKSDEIWVAPGKLEAYIQEETGGQQALPS